jgi:hypothetical protein
MQGKEMSKPICSRTGKECERDCDMDTACMGEHFSVCQFFIDGTYEYVRRYVSAEEAVKAARHYISNVAIRMGYVSRVIITDGGDMTCFEWKLDEGITFPPEAKGRQ